MKVDKRLAMKSLSKKGFKRDETGDHIYFLHQRDGKETGIKTYVSHSPKQKDISGDLLHSMKRQLRLQTTQEARDLLDCAMGAETYVNLLVDRGHLG